MKNFGGAELLIVELANQLTKKGVKNDILTAAKSPEIEKLLMNTRLIIPKNDLSFSPTGFNSIKDILKFIRIFRKALKKIKNHYDVINFHNFPSTWCLWPWKKPSVWMLNEPPNLWSKPNAGFFLKSLNKIRNFIDKLIVRRSVDVICVSDELNKNRALKRYGMPSRIINYGINYEFFSRGNAEIAEKKWGLKGRFAVMQSGMITEVKNQLESIKTINKAKNHIKNILLILAGKADEVYNKKIQDYIKKNNLEKYVLLTGNLSREDLRDLYRACNVGLFPVGQQGGWLAPFELLCSGNPIVVSKEMGAASLINRFDLGIATNDYTAALLEVYHKQEVYMDKAEKAALFVKKNLGWGIFAEKMIKAFKDSLNR